jgi:hypothetical protein
MSPLRTSFGAIDVNRFFASVLGYPILLPLPVAGRFAGLLGQPRDLALRGQRLSRRRRLHRITIEGQKLG